MTLSNFALLTDQNIQPSVVTFLRSQGFDVLDINEQGLQGLDDEAILAIASREKRVVITHDSDFGTLAILGGASFIGIIYLRPGHLTGDSTIQSIRAILLDATPLTPKFIVVAKRNNETIRVRIRHVP